MFLIIPILIAISLLSFLCASDHRHLHSFPTRRSSDLAAAKTSFTDIDAYDNFNAAQAQTIEPSLSYTNNVARTEEHNTEIQSPTYNERRLLAENEKTTQFGLSDRSGVGGPGTRYCSST